jgi:sulfur relay (sulfurtransferase) complex TusBCD TusD component (DsrE family)
VKVLVIVNESPWGSTLAATALRLVRSLLACDHSIDAVFFRGDGVYNLVAGQGEVASDLAGEWGSLAAAAGFPLLLCSSATARRLDPAPGGRFRAAGLAEVLERMASCDRVVTF